MKRRSPKAQADIYESLPQPPSISKARPEERQSLKLSLYGLLFATAPEHDEDAKRVFHGLSYSKRFVLTRQVGFEQYVL